MKRLFAVLVALTLGILIFSGAGTAVNGDVSSQEPQEAEPPATDEQLTSSPEQSAVQTLAQDDEKRATASPDRKASIIVGATAGFLALALLALWGRPGKKQCEKKTMRS